MIDPTIVAAVIAAIATLIGVLLSQAFSRKAKREDTASAGLDSVLKSWRDFCMQLQAELDHERKARQNHEQRISNCERDRYQLHSEINALRARMGIGTLPSLEPPPPSSSSSS